MVDIGGDICCFGSPEGRTHWRIGVQDPTRPDKNMTNAQTLMVLELAAAPDSAVAVATSGNYRRFEVIEGEQHSHIIDTKSGQSSDKLASVTIIAPDATTADALATAVSVLGAEKGLELIERTPGVEAILIPAALPLKIIKSSGAEAYIDK
jgi:thiamine biosynthesis lipoprotein